MREGDRVGGLLRAVCRGKRVPMEAMRGMYEVIVLLTLTYGNVA